jgi:hypothetical protein
LVDPLVVPETFDEPLMSVEEDPVVPAMSAFTDEFVVPAVVFPVFLDVLHCTKKCKW